MSRNIAWRDVQTTTEVWAYNYWGDMKKGRNLNGCGLQAAYWRTSNVEFVFLPAAAIAYRAGVTSTGRGFNLNRGVTTS